MAYALSTIFDRAGQGTRAILAATRSCLHQRQKWTRTGRANPWGTCAPIPAVVNDQPQDTPACRGGFTFLTLQVTCRGLRGSGLSLAREVTR